MFEAKNVIIKAFFISLAIHAVLLSLFAFTFTAKPAPQKPFVIFLGSILRKYDLTIVDSDSAAHAIGNAQELNISLNRSGNRDDLIKEPSLKKPAYSQSLIKEPKATTKTLFEEPLINRPSEQDIDILDIEEPLPPRQPLKLDQP